MDENELVRINAVVMYAQLIMLSNQSPYEVYGEWDGKIQRRFMSKERQTQFHDRFTVIRLDGDSDAFTCINSVECVPANIDVLVVDEMAMCVGNMHMEYPDVRIATGLAARFKRSTPIRTTGNVDLSRSPGGWAWARPLLPSTIYFIACLGER